MGRCILTASLLDLMGDTGQKPQAVAADKPDTPVKTEHVELDLVLHYENEVKGEVLVSKDGHESKAVWLAKSHIEMTATMCAVPAWSTQGKPLQNGLPLYAVNCPQWLAKEKGLI